MKLVTNYLKNVTKSIAYAAADVGKEELMPNAAEFASDNKQFLTATYAVLKNPPVAIRKSVTAIQNSKIYQALDYGVKNVFEDLRTGNFYNKERDERDEMKFAGMDVSDINDLSEFGISDDWESQLENNEPSLDPATEGDLKIVDAIEGSNASVASSTVNAIIATSEAQINNSRVNTGSIYVQNERLFGGLHKDLSVLGATMDSLHKVTSAALQNIDKNISDFFTSETKLNTERNNILKTILEMEQNKYKSAADKEKEAKAKAPNKTSWSDINSGGLPNFDRYFEVIKSNISKQVQSIGLPGFGDDSNMLAAMMTSPLKYALTSVINGIIPSTVKAATKEFDKTLSGIFGQLIAKIDNNREKNGIGGFISKIFGINTKVSKNIDTSRYEKGPVPFDGIVRKAITEVIPSYLRRIEAYITGNPEQVYSYSDGKWVNMNTVIERYKDIRKNAIRSGTRDISEALTPAFNALRSSDVNEEESLNKAKEEFYEYLYDNNGVFNPNFNAEKNGIDASNYPNLAKHYNKIVAAYKNFDKTTIFYRGGKTTRNTKYSTRLNIASSVLSAKEQENRQYREIETGDSAIEQYVSALKVDNHGKWDKDRKNFTPSEYLIKAKDNLGNNIFTYLQNINKELTWQRRFGFEDLFGVLANIFPSMENFINTIKNTANTNTIANNTNINYQQPSGYNNHNGILLPSNVVNTTTNNNNVVNQYNSSIRDNRLNEHNTAFNSIDLESESHKSERVRREESKNRFNEDIRNKALKAITEGKAIDASVFEDEDISKYIDYLSGIIEEENSENYKEELKGYDSGAVAQFFDKYFYKNNYKSIKDVREAAEKAAEQESNKDNLDEKEKTFLDKLLNKISETGSIAGGVIGASGDIFANLMYTADKAVYEMMYKTELKDDEDGEKYEGFMDMIAGKINNTFDTVKDGFKDKILDPFKKWLGIDDDKIKGFKDSFSGEIKNLGSSLWKSFVDSNKEIWKPVGDEVLRQVGLKDGETIQQKNRRANREKGISDLDEVGNMTSMYDPRFIHLMKEYNLNFVDYGTNFQAAKADLEKEVKKRFYKNTNDFKEVSTEKELNTAINYVSDDIDEIRKIAKVNGIHLPEDDSDPQNIVNEFSKGITQLKNLTPGFDSTKDKYGRTVLNKTQTAYKSKESRDKVNKAIIAAVSAPNSPLANEDLLKQASDLGFNGTREEKIAMLKKIDPKLKDEHIEKLDTDEKLALRFLRMQRKNFAKGTMGRPFMGDTMLSKGELLFNSKGVSRVNKTDAYSLTEPTHILNSEDSYDLLSSIGVDKKELGVKSTIQQDLGRENLVKKRIDKSIPNHASGTNMKITNDGVTIDSEQIFGEAKKYVAEGAAGGLVGGILSLVLGLAGGPILGAAVGSATSIIRNSDNLKTSLFGKLDKNGKRDGSGIINKTIVKAAQKYAPDMFKYGLAGIIPGLLTPLGPVGGLMAGAAIGFLKNNERFTNKYFGENGKLTIGTKEKAIIDKMLPNTLKGAGIGAVATLFGGPFGLIGNAAIGAAIGMVTSTDEFKDSLFGKEINGVRHGGIVNIIKDAFAPLADAGREFKDKILNAVEKNIINPINEFITPFLHELPNIAGYIPRKFNEYLLKKFAKPFEQYIKTMVLDKLKPITDKVAGAAGSLFNFVTTPIRAIGKIGEGIRTKQIEKREAHYMTAEERINWLNTHDKGDKVSKFDKALADMDAEGSEFTSDVAKQLKNDLSMAIDSYDAVANARRKTEKKIGRTLINYKTSDGKSLSKNAIDAVDAAIKSGHPEQVAGLLSKYALNGSDVGLSKEQAEVLMNELNPLLSKRADLADRQTKLAGRTKEQQSEAQKKAKESLKKLGIDINLDDHKAVNDIIENINTELVHREANKDSEGEREARDIENSKLFKSMAEDIHIMVTEGIHIANGDTEEQINQREKVDADLEKATNNASESAERRSRAISKQTTGRYTGFEDIVKDTEEKARVEAEEAGITNPDEIDKFVKEKTDKVRAAIDTLSARPRRSSFSSKTSADMQRMNKNAKAYSKGRVTQNEMVAAGGEVKRIDKIKKKGILFNDKEIEEIVEYINRLTKTDFNTLNNFFKKKYTKEFLYRVKLSKIDFEAATNILAVEKFNNCCKVLLNNGKTFDDFGSIEAVLNTNMGKYIYDPNRDRSQSSNNESNSTSDQVNNAFNRLGVSDRDNNDSSIPLPGDIADPETSIPLPGRIEPEVIPNNALGTVLFKGASKVAGGLLGLAGNGVKKVVKGIGNLGKKAVSSLSNKDNDSKESSDILSKMLNNEPKEELKTNSSFPESDVKGDKRDPVQFAPGEFGLVKRDSSGNIEPDTSDSKTKQILMKIGLNEKMAQKVQDAQIKTAEILKNAFDVSDDPEAKKHKWSWWKLLIAGGILWKTGILQKLFNGVIKPIWTNHISPWLTNTVKPWIINTAIPALTDGILWVGKQLIDILSQTLPGIIAAAIKGIPSALGSIGNGILTFLDGLTGNKTNTGAETVVDSSKMSNETQTDIYGNSLNYMTDENGKRLTAEDIENHNYNKIYNAEGVEGTIDEEGKLHFKDASAPGSGYAKVTANAAIHSFAHGGKGIGGLLVKGTDKLADKLLKRKKGPFKLLSKMTGAGLKAVTKPVKAAGKLGNYLGKIGSEKLFGESTYRAVTVAEKAGKEAAEKAAREVTETAAEKAAKEAVDKSTEKAFKEAMEKVGKESVEDVAEKAASKVANKTITEVAESGAKSLSKTAGKFATEAAETAGKSIAKAGGKLKSNKLISGIIEKLTKIIGDLFSDSKVFKRLSDAAQSVGASNVGKWITKLKNKVIELFKKASKNITNKVSEQTIKKGASKLNLITTIASIAADFLIGCDQAESILGVKETSLIEEITAGIVNALCNLSIIFAIAPGPGWFAKGILEFFGDDITERQKEADAEYEQYKADSGSTKTKEEYLKEKYSVTGNLGGIAKKAWNTVKSSASGIVNTVKLATKGAVKLLTNPSAAVNTVKNVASSAGKAVSKAMSKVKSKSPKLISKIIEKLTKIIGDLFSNSKVLKKLTSAAQALGASDIGKWIAKLKDKVIKLFNQASKNVAKNVSKETVKKAASKLNLIVTIAAVVTDFIVGCDQAESILGVKETTIVEEITAGLVNALCNFSIIFAIWPGTSWFAQHLLEFFGDDLSERQKEADAEYEKYKEETGSTETKEEYLKKKYSVTGNIKGALGKAWNGIKNFGSNVADGAKNIGTVVANGVKNVGEGISNTFHKTVDIGKKVLNIWPTVSKFVMKGDMDGLKKYQIFGEADGVIGAVGKALSGIVQTIATPPTLISKGVHAIGNKISNLINFDNIKNGIANIGSNIFGFIKNGDLDGLKKYNVFGKSDGIVGTIGSALSGVFRIFLTPPVLISKGIHALGNGISNIISGLTNLKTDETEEKIKQAEEGKISVFSSEYWEVKEKDDGVIGTIKNIFNKVVRFLNVPILFIRNIFSLITGPLTKAISWIKDKVKEAQKILSDPLSYAADAAANTAANAATSDNKFVSTLGTAGSLIIGTGKTIYNKIFGKGTEESNKTKYSEQIPNKTSDSKYNVKYGMGYSKQIDPKISNIRYNSKDDTSYQTIGNSGCGPAAAVNAMEAMYGKGSGIVDAANFALDHGYKEKDGGTKPQFFTDYFANNGYGSQTTSNKSQLEENIRSGAPTVLMGQDSNGVSPSTPYGKTPHYVTATGTDENGHVIVQDPESKYDNQLYSMNDLMSKTQFGVSAFGKNFGKYGRGTTEEQMIWWYLKQMGMTEQGAAGLMGNMYSESGIRTNNLQNSYEKSLGYSDESYTEAVDNGKYKNFANDSAGYGLVQWTYKTRKKALLDYIKNNNKGSIASLSGQLEYLGHELKNDYKSVYKTLTTTNSVKDASNSVLLKFEKPASMNSSSTQNKRADNGKKFYDKYKGTDGTKIDDSKITNESSSTVSSTNDSSSDTSDESNTSENTQETIFSILSDVIANSQAGKALSSFLGTLSSSTSSSESSEDDESSANNSSESESSSSSGTSASGDAAKMVSLAQKEVGNKEKPMGSNSIKYNDWFFGKHVSGSPYAWCASFIAWLANKAGASNAIAKSACCKPTRTGTIKLGGKDVKPSTAKPGDLIFFNTSQGKCCHIGLVEYTDNKNIHTIEGNTSDMVARRYYAKTSPKIFSVTRPAYKNTSGNSINVTSSKGSSGDSTNYKVLGSNGIKPIAKFGQFKDSIYGKGITISNSPHSELIDDAGNRAIVESPSVDVELEKIEKSHTRKNVYGTGTAERVNIQPTVLQKFGGATSANDNTQLINTIITILYTIADNTDKLNTIVAILNKKLNIEITPQDVSDSTGGESLKSKLKNSIENNTFVSTSKINNYADTIADSSLSTIIQAMNAIASE